MDPRFVRPQHNAGMYPIRTARTQHSDTYGEYIRDEHTWSGLAARPAATPCKNTHNPQQSHRTILKIRDPFRMGNGPLSVRFQNTNTTASQLTEKVCLPK